MINLKMKNYNYFTLGELDDYGQPQLSTEPVGTIKMAVFTSNIANVDNIKFKDATYIGLTLAEANDTYVIDLGNENNERLKVLYVNPDGRYKIVYLKEI